jgi:hypothetical protein
MQLHCFDHLKSGALLNTVCTSRDFYYKIPLVVVLPVGLRVLSKEGLTHLSFVLRARTSTLIDFFFVLPSRLTSGVRTRTGEHSE